MSCKLEIKLFRGVNLRLQNEKDEPKLSDLEKELNDLKAEEVRLLDELEALQKEEAETLKAIEEQEAIAKKIAVEEERYRKEFTRHQKEFMALEDEGRR